MLDIVGLNFGILRNFDQSWSSTAMFLTSATCCLNNLWKPPEAAEYQLQSLKRKIRRYALYLHNFDRPLGLPGHIRRCFWRRQRVIFSKNDGMSPWQLPLTSVLEHQSTILHAHFSVYFA